MFKNDKKTIVKLTERINEAVVSKLSKLTLEQFKTLFNKSIKSVEI